MFYTKQNKKERGFTLAETLVVIAITAITILATMQIIADMIKIQNRTLAQETMFDQISYFFDYLSKDIRMADTDKDGRCNNYFLDASGSGSGWTVPSPDQRQMIYQSPAYGESDIFFLNQRNECVRYFLNPVNKQILLDKCKPGAPMCLDRFSLPLTSDDFFVNSLKLSIAGQSQTDKKLPIVTVVLQMQNKRFQDVKVLIQTTVSQRNLDVF